MPPATPTAPDPDAPECFVCHKHQARGPLMPGGPVGEDDLVVVSHLAPGSSGRPVYLGHLFVEPWRHAPGPGERSPNGQKHPAAWYRKLRIWSETCVPTSTPRIAIRPPEKGWLSTPPAAKSEIAGGSPLVR
jgi:hypothetical protein